MILNRAHGIRAVVAIIFVALSVADASSGPAPIVPLHANIHFSRTSSAPVWSTYIYSATGKKAYILWLEPEYTTLKDVLAVDLVLNEGEHRNPDSNLLAPTKNWHGLQRFVFNAGDLTQGPDKMVYGASRTLPGRDGGFVVQVKVLGAKVSEISQDRIPARVRRLQSDWYQLDGLDMTISVENVSQPESSGSNTGN